MTTAQVPFPPSQLEITVTVCPQSEAPNSFTLSYLDIAVTVSNQSEAPNSFTLSHLDIAMTVRVPPPPPPPPPQRLKLIYSFLPRNLCHCLSPTHLLLPTWKSLSLFVPNSFNFSYLEISVTVCPNSFNLSYREIAVTFCPQLI